MVSQDIAGYLRISQSFASLEYQERVKDFKKQSHLIGMRAGFHGMNRCDEVQAMASPSDRVKATEKKLFGQEKVQEMGAGS
jgi:hypothetical protein